VFSVRQERFFKLYKNFVLQKFNSLWLSVDFCPVASRRRLTLTSSRQNVGQTAELFLTIFELKASAASTHSVLCIPGTSLDHNIFMIYSNEIIFWQPLRPAVLVIPCES